MLGHISIKPSDILLYESKTKKPFLSLMTTQSYYNMIELIKLIYKVDDDEAVDLSLVFLQDADMMDFYVELYTYIVDEEYLSNTKSSYNKSADVTSHWVSETRLWSDCWKETIPDAVVANVRLDDFWELTPKQLRLIFHTFSKLKEADYNKSLYTTWLSGLYNAKAFNSPKDLPREPLSIGEKSTIKSKNNKEFAGFAGREKSDAQVRKLRALGL